MKKNIFILLAVFAAGTFGSCNEQLDLPIDGRIPYEGIWSDRNRTMGYLNKCYDFRPNARLELSAFTDEAQSVKDVINNSDYMRWYEGTIGSRDWLDGSNNYGLDMGRWSVWYEGIRYCNVFIKEIPTATAYSQPDEKAGWLSQAKTLRAWYYLSLIKTFGPCPLLTEAYEVNHDYSKDRRNAVWEIVQQILKDTDEALAAPGNNLDASLGFRWVINVDNANYMYRAMAYAIRSQAILWAVSPLFAGETGNPYTWEDAARITKEALDQCLTHDFALYTELPENPTNAQNAYAFYFLTEYTYDRAIDKETIYTSGDFKLSIWQNYGMLSTPQSSTAGFSPTQELVDAYESVEKDDDGNIINAYSVLDLSKPYNDADHLSPNYNPSNTVYSSTDPYANRDPRFYSSIYFNGAVRYLAEPDKLVEIHESATDHISATDSKQTRTGYYLRKWNHNKSDKDNNLDGYFRMFRLAELYLNFAEAANQAYGPSVSVEAQAPGAAAMSADEAVNAIRARAGMPEVTVADKVSVSSFHNKIMNERRIEFAFEGLRFYDVRRWKLVDQTDRVVTGMKATKAGESFNYDRFVVSKRNTYDAKFLLRPLPMNDVNVMYKHTGVDWQNPGYEGAN